MIFLITQELYILEELSVKYFSKTFANIRKTLNFAFSLKSLHSLRNYKIIFRSLIVIFAK